MGSYVGKEDVYGDCVRSNCLYYILLIIQSETLWTSLTYMLMRTMETLMIWTLPSLKRQLRLLWVMPRFSSISTSTICINCLSHHYQYIAAFVLWLVSLWEHSKYSERKNWIHWETIKATLKASGCFESVSCQPSSNQRPLWDCSKWALRLRLGYSEWALRLLWVCSGVTWENNLMSTKFKSTLATLGALISFRSLGCSRILSEQPGTNMVFPDVESVMGLLAGDWPHH